MTVKTKTDAIYTSAYNTHSKYISRLYNSIQQPTMTFYVPSVRKIICKYSARVPHCSLISWFIHSSKKKKLAFFNQKSIERKRTKKNVNKPQKMTKLHNHRTLFTIADDGKLHSQSECLLIVDPNYLKVK